MLNCRWSLENEQSFKYWGGVSADPVVSAVLNAVGKRYLVESWKADDGRSWFNRYSDGFIEQGGQTSTNGDVTFPVQFESIVLSVDRTNNWGRAATAANELGTSISSITLTGISMQGVSGKTYWRAEGY